MPNRKRLVVLVAEDHPVNRKVLGLLLESLGVQADFANTGKKVVEAAVNFNYGVILMDCMLPELDGFQAAFQIRKYEFAKSRHTPIIATTAIDKDQIIDKCVHAGMNDFIAKPIDRDILSQKIAYWSIIPMTLAPLSEVQEAEIRNLEMNAAPIDRSYLMMLHRWQKLDDILELFLSVTEKLLTQLESAIENRDVKNVRQMAHEIEGSSYAVSASEMTKLCLELEHIGEEQNWSETEKLCASLGLAFARVRELLEGKRPDKVAASYRVA